MGGYGTLITTRAVSTKRCVAPQHAVGLARAGASQPNIDHEHFCVRLNAMIACFSFRRLV